MKHIKQIAHDIILLILIMATGGSEQVVYLFELHLLEHVHGKVLKAPDVDGALLGSGQVATTNTQI